jgi:hypothetical protein
VDQHAAIDVDDGAGDVAGEIRGEEQAGAGHVVGFAQPVDRDPLEDLPLHLLGELAGGDVGLDQARRDRIDTDAVGAEFARHRLGQAEHPGLGRAVVRAAEDAAAALRRDRREADDRPGVAGAHIRDDRLRHVQRPAQAYVRHRLVVLGLDVHQLKRLGDAGVVDQHVDLPESPQHLVGRRLTLLQVGDVAGDPDMLVAQLGRCGPRLFGVKVEDGHTGPVTGE